MVGFLLPILLSALFASTAFAKPLLEHRNLQRRAPLKIGRSDGKTECLRPKVFIVSLFTPEAQVWQEPLGLFANNVTIPGLSPLIPQIYCDKKGDICQVVTGEGEINAASSISALATSSLFELSETYFLTAGIAGINPACGTLGSVSLARYAVQVGLEYEIDAREKPTAFSSGYVPLGAKVPNQYPVFEYGSEVFEFNVALRDRAFKQASTGKLDDGPVAMAYRKKYPHAPANKPPTVIKGDVTTSDAFFHGALLGDAFGDYVVLITNGTGRYCTTAQEDNAVSEALLRSALFGRVDFSRIIALRTAANFDRPPPGETVALQLFNDNQGGFVESLSNIYIAGRPIVDDIINNWQSTFKAGIEPRNYVGDIFNSLKGPIAPDIGNVNFQTG